jgi:hypothetical protein
MHHAACHTPRPRGLALPDVLPWVMDGLAQRGLPQEPCVPEAPQARLHVLAACRQELEPLGNEGIGECLGKSAASAAEVSAEPGPEARD